MKAVISTTYSDTYLFFLPITTWCWNKLGVNVICFMPQDLTDYQRYTRLAEVNHCLVRNNLKCDIKFFDCPEHKEATYAQCSRLYGACLDLPEEEVLVIGDVDMAMFQIPKYEGGFTITGYDLVPKGQYPACYVSSKVKDWRNAFKLNGITYQQALDRLLGDDECQDYRACRWSVDQEQLYKNISLDQEINLIPRTNGQTPFAQNRVDRTDLHYMDRLDFNIFDAHLWRDGFQEDNFKKIVELMQFMYPDENFDWLISYTEQYRALL
jgi:hypothetical protein